MPKSETRLLLADDEVFIREGLYEALERPGLVIDAAADGHEARRLLGQRHYDLIVTDLRMPGPSGLELLEEAQEKSPDTPVIILTAYGSISTAVEAMRKGAYDFATKPIDIAHLRLVVDRALEHTELLAENRKLHDLLENQDAFRKIVRQSSAMQAATKTLKQVAQADVPVLLRGETGVGKELFARTIHERSKRHEGPFIAVNCGGFTEDLFSSELFGHARGAFTGAHAERPGRFALAEKGTLFLDEIGEVPLKNQTELLRSLENKEYQPLGDPRVRQADVRFVAATNRDLEESVKKGTFREDLYYRLNVVPIDIPPVRQRDEDIPILIEMFLDEACRANGQPAKKISAEAMIQLVNYDWPGNVREVRNLVQRLAVTCPSRTIRPSHLKGILQQAPTPRGQFNIPLGSSLEEVEAALIRQTLERVTSNRREAAAVLGISVRSLQYKIKQYGIPSR
jgi:DNA-binding NtrC family response regulator